MGFWENAKTILETLVALGILIAGFSGFKLFKYKVNSEDRKLYLENCLAVRKVLGKIYENGVADNNDINTLSIAYQNALIYLDKEISDFVKKVSDLVISLYGINISPELPVGEERTKLAEKMKHILLELDECNKQSIEIYRHHIVSEPIKDFKNWFKKIKPLLHLRTNKPKAKS